MTDSTTITAPTNMQVSQTILQQLGGRRFLAMTGAKHLVGSNDALTMQLPGARCNGKRCTGARIVLDADDTYTVEAFAIRKLELKVLDSRSGVYCDVLQEVFTSLTGLYTHL